MNTFLARGQIHSIHEVKHFCLKKSIFFYSVACWVIDALVKKKSVCFLSLYLSGVWLCVRCVRGQQSLPYRVSLTCYLIGFGLNEPHQLYVKIITQVIYMHIDAIYAMYTLWMLLDYLIRGRLKLGQLALPWNTNSQSDNSVTKAHTYPPDNFQTILLNPESQYGNSQSTISVLSNYSKLC